MINYQKMINEVEEAQSDRVSIYILVTIWS